MCQSIDIFICSWLCLLPILFESLLSNSESLHVYFQSFPCPVSRHIVILFLNQIHFRTYQKLSEIIQQSDFHFQWLYFFGYVWSMKLLSPHFFCVFILKCDDVVNFYEVPTFASKVCVIFFVNRITSFSWRQLFHMLFVKTSGFLLLFKNKQ